jgi:hypothetical protein
MSGRWLVSNEIRAKPANGITARSESKFLARTRIGLREYVKFVQKKAQSISMICLKYTAPFESSLEVEMPSWKSERPHLVDTRYDSASGLSTSLEYGHFT